MTNQTNQTNPTNGTNPADLGDDLTILKVTRRNAGSGTWVIGTLAGHRFEALVFPQHASDPGYELGDSRISKLWLRREADKATVFNFDRGLDRPAADRRAAEVVDYLCAGLAEHTYGDACDDSNGK